VLQIHVYICDICNMKQLYWLEKLFVPTDRLHKQGNAVRQSLEETQGNRTAERTGSTVHRTVSHPRGHEPAGVRDAARA